LTDEPQPERHDAYAALRNPYVRSFIVGRSAATIGAQIISVAVGWELYERTGDVWALALVGLFEVAPVVFLMLPSGNAADRYPRRNLAMLAYSLLTVAALGLALISWLQAPVEVVYAMLVVIGSARAIASPSVGTILPQILEPRQFANSQAWLISSFQLSSICGPAIGGILIALMGGATGAYVVAAVGELIFVATLATLPSIAPIPSGAKRSLAEVFAGFLFIKRNPIFAAAITLDLFGVLLGGAVSLLPVLAKDILGTGPEGLGLLRAAPGVGALLTALTITRLPPWQRPGRVLLMTVAGFGVATVAFGLSRDLWLSMACLFFVGATDAVSMVIRGTLQQMITPDHLRGRVAAVNYMFINFSNELGGFESAAVAKLVGPIWSVVGGGVGTLAVVVLVMVLWPQLARIGPLHTLRPAEEDLLPPRAEHAAGPAGA